MQVHRNSGLLWGHFRSLSFNSSRKKPLKSLQKVKNTERAPSISFCAFAQTGNKANHHFHLVYQATKKKRAWSGKEGRGKGGEKCADCCTLHRWEKRFPVLASIQNYICGTWYRVGSVLSFTCLTNTIIFNPNSHI